MNNYDQLVITQRVFTKIHVSPWYFLRTSLYPWGIVPEMSAKGITHPAGQYLLEEKKTSSQDTQATATLTIL